MILSCCLSPFLLTFDWERKREEEIEKKREIEREKKKKRHGGREKGGKYRGIRREEERDICS